ncbi:MAG: efflux RND transporter periplasmic adaptor subunit [Burkholderiaceae bacterium]|nr:efflux RND transporter periplasmic adaptor subunit [Burkholderiaceae bacterium]
MRRWPVTAIAITLALAAGAAALWLRPEPPPPAIAAQPAPARAPADGPAGTAEASAPAAIEFAGTDLYTVRTGTIARTIPVTGTLTPVERTTVKAKLAGDIVELAVREGEAVRQGQLLARFDPTDFELRVREREAQLRSAQAQLAQAQRTLENNRRLLEKQFISQNAFDNASSAVDVALAARDAAAAQLNQARKALADTRITAPMSGSVADRFAQVGEKLPADARILSIVDLSRMEIEAPVPASEIAAVRIGQPVSLSIEGIDGEQVGRVARINPGTQPGTRSVPIYIALSFPPGEARVRAGMFAQGRLALQERRDVLVVPLASIRDAGGRQFVYLIDGGRLAERDLRVGLRDESAPAGQGAVGLAEVREGLKAGDSIVGVNPGTLRTGSRVAIAPASAPRPAPAPPGAARPSPAGTARP